MIESASATGVSNRILRAVPPATLERLRPHLNYESLQSRHVLFRVGDPVKRLHFINRGIASLVHTMHDGRTVELGAIGIEGLADANALFDGNRAVLECVVQIPGESFTIAREILLDEMSRDPALRRLLLAYQNLTISQLAQTAACNRLHTLVQRCCRWLLIGHDSAGSDTFALTHEFLAMMLGVRRPGVTLAARDLQSDGLIRYSRGQVTVVDRRGLEQMSCECYAHIRDMIDHLFAPGA